MSDTRNPNKLSKFCYSDLNSAIEINNKNENILLQRFSTFSIHLFVIYYKRAKLNLKLGKCYDAEKDFTSLQK